MEALDGGAGEYVKTGADELASRRLNMDVVEASQSKLTADGALADSLAAIVRGVTGTTENLSSAHSRSKQLLALLSSDADE